MQVLYTITHFDFRVINCSCIMEYLNSYLYSIINLYPAINIYHLSVVQCFYKQNMSDYRGLYVNYFWKQSRMDDFWQTETLICKVVIDAGKSIPQIHLRKLQKNPKTFRKTSVKIFFARHNWLRFNWRIRRRKKWPYDLHDSGYTYRINEKKDTMDMI